MIHNDAKDYRYSGKAQPNIVRSHTIMTIGIVKLSLRGNVICRLQADAKAQHLNPRGACGCCSSTEKVNEYGLAVVHDLIREIFRCVQHIINNTLDFVHDCRKSMLVVSSCVGPKR